MKPYNSWRLKFLGIFLLLFLAGLATIWWWRSGVIVAKARFDPGIAPFTLEVRRVPVPVTASKHFIVELYRGQYVVTSFRYFWAYNQRSWCCAASATSSKSIPSGKKSGEASRIPRNSTPMPPSDAKKSAIVVTVAVRRVNLTDKTKESLVDHIDRSKIFILPNTAGCYIADEAIRTARLAREVGLSNWVKLEVIGDHKTLFPDNEGLLEATRVLVKEGFVVLPYTNDDPVNARKLMDAGAAAVMPLAVRLGLGDAEHDESADSS